MRNFKDLKVWNKAHQLVLATYRATATFPKEEMYSLTSQTRRAASSIPANIAKGCGRQGNAELVRFLHIAMGSASELEYHLLLAHDLNILDQVTYECLARDVVDVKRMLTSLIQKLKADC